MLIKKPVSILSSEITPREVHQRPLIYGAILAALLGFRLWHRARRDPGAVAVVARQALP
jgi:hypothetical protein